MRRETGARSIARRGLTGRRTGARRWLGTASSTGAILIALIQAVPAHAQQAGAALLFRDARVFDGERVIEGVDVLVRDGRIVRVGRVGSPPAEARVVDGAGRTLLPGLIDAHTHAFGNALRQAVVFGVTTELDMFTDHALAARLRAEQAAGDASGRADLFSAGTLVTAPGGHGTEYGMRIPTLASPESAQAFVDARIAEGSDYIKIVYDDGAAYGMDMPTLSREALRAVIEAAHRRDELAVVHIGSRAGAEAAIEAGADGLVHLFVDGSPGAGFGRLAAAHDVFVIPTLAVLSSIAGTGAGAALARDARLDPFLGMAARSGLTRRFPFSARADAPATSYAAAEIAVRRLRDAGVPILAGTDAPNPGTAHGASIHQELELLVRAGLTPAEALAAATSVPADAFGFDDRGRIAPGRRADLLLVEGDPTADIRATRAIVGIWKGGVPVDRAAFARRVAHAREAAGRAPEELAGGVVSDFERGEPTGRFGTAWIPSTDAMAGGESSGELSVVDGGANGSARALRVSGTISDAISFGWYGAMWSPGAEPMAPADLSSVDGLRFWTRGDGRTYRVMVFSQSRGFMPLTETFVAGPEWSEIVVPWSEFGIDGSDVMAVIFAGGPRPGSFEFRVDDVRLR